MLPKTVPDPYSGNWKSSVAVGWESGTGNRQFVRRSGTQTPSKLSPTLPLYIHTYIQVIYNAHNVKQNGWICYRSCLFILPICLKPKRELSYQSTDVIGMRVSMRIQRATVPSSDSCWVNRTICCYARCLRTQQAIKLLKQPASHSLLYCEDLTAWCERQLPERIADATATFV